MLLLLDNAPAHPSADKLTSHDGKITTMFLPPNTTAVLQPLDQGLLEAMKRRYKKYLLRHIILENSASSLTVPDIVKGLTTRDVVYWISQAWEEVSPITIKKSWKKLIPAESVDTGENASNDANENASSDANKGSSSDDFIDLFQELGYSEDNESWESPQDWLAEDSTDPSNQIMTDFEIVAEVTRDKDCESDDEIEQTPSVSKGAFT